MVHHSEWSRAYILFEKRQQMKRAHDVFVALIQFLKKVAVHALNNVYDSTAHFQFGCKKRNV